MAFDFSNISDEELEAMAAQSAPASEPMPQKPLSEWTDEELEAYAAEPTPAPAQPAAQPPRKMTREERIAQNQRAIETARSQEDPGFLSAVGEALAEGARGAGRAVKAAGQGVLGTVTSAVRLAGTPVRAVTGWDGIHKLADKIDKSYANFGRDALMSEYGENPDDWGYALGRAGEKVAGVAGSLAGLGAAGKAVQAASGAAKMAGLARTAKVAENALPLMFGNDAAVRAYDTARANGKSKAEAAALAGLNGAIHFFGFKAFENQSLKKMLNIGPEVEVMMPKWADALADEGGQSFSSLVRGTRNGMVKYIAAERGKGALKAGGIMGLQDMLSDPVMQVAEGADIDDIDFSRMLKAGAHGVGEGALMEGLMGGAAILRSQNAAKKFVADKYFRGKDYKVMGADGKMHDEPGVLNTPQGRMLLMKQNPDATERVLDIVEHGGKPTEAELDAAFLPPDMTVEELKKFASDWRKDLEPYVDEAWAADAPRQTAAPDAASAKPGRDMLSPEEAQSQQKATNDAAERQKVADRRAAADSMMLDFESWNRLYTDGKTDLNFDEWRAAGKPGVIEANLTPKTEEAPTSETRANEAPAQPEQGEVAEPPAGEAAKPVEGATPPREASDAGVVEPPVSISEKISPVATEKPAETAEPVKEAPKTDASLTIPARPAENGPTAAPKPPEAQTPAEPAKPVEAASRASDATPAVSAPDKANDAQKAALAKLGEGKGVAVTSAEMGKGGVLRVKYTMPSADGRVVEFDSTIDAEGKTSTSVAGVKTAPAPAVQTGEVTSLETPAPATQAQTNIPNEKNSAASAPVSRTVRGNLVEKRLRPILDFVRNEDGSFNPDALRNHDGNNGLPLKDLKLLNEHPEIVDDLGLPAEETAALKSALTEAYNTQRVATPNSKEGKVSKAGQANYSVSASKALERLAKHPNNPKVFAIAQQQVSAALEAAKRQTDENGRKSEQSISFWQERLDELNTKFDALPKETQGAILRQAQSLQGKLQAAERKGRKSNTTAEGEELDIADEGRDMGEDNVMSDEQADAEYGDEARFERAAASETKAETDNEKNSAGILRDTDKDLGRRGIQLETKGGKTNVVWRNEMGDVVRRAPLDMLEKAAKKDPAIKDLIEKLKQGEQIRAAKSDAADLPDAWTPETQKPLERVAHALRNVVTAGGKRIKVLFVPRPKDADGNTRKSISGIFTGTAADYANRSRRGGVDDGPSLKKIGTGEGSQVYGWGLYGSTVRGVAEHYANRRNLIEDLADAVLERASGSNEIALDDLRADKRLPREDRFLKMSDEEIDIVEKYIKGEDISKYETGNLYEQTFFTNRAPGDESHLLKWYEPVSEENLNRMAEYARKMESDGERKFEIFDPDDVIETIETARREGWTAQKLYDSLTSDFNQIPRYASNFLARAGIDGVKYPVDSYGGKGVKDGDEAGWNYVSFRDDNIRVDHKWTDGNLRYMKNAEGVTVGEYDAAKGEIRLYPGARVADVVHEFTHPLVDFARAEAKAGRGELLGKINQIIDAERETWEQPVRDAYKGKSNETILEEIFTHAMGEKGAKLFGKSTNTLQGRRWYNQLWQAIKGLWQDFATKMGWNKADLRGLERMSPEEAARHILSEMAKGRSFGDAKTGGEGTRNAMVDSSPSTSIPSRLGKIKDWFSKGGEDNYVFKNHPADWSMHDTSQPEFDRVSKESRLAEAVGRLENPGEFWKAFLPTGTEKVVIRTKNGNVALLRDVYKYLSRGRFGYTTATERAANGKFANAGALHFLLNGHIAEGGYKTSKSVLTAKEINDNFQRCLDSPVKYDKKNRPYHEIDIGHGVKMHIGTAFIRVDGKMSEVPITIESNRRDEYNRRICERVAKEMSEGSVHISAQGGAATSTRTDNSVSNPPAESQGGVRESRRVVLPQPPAPSPKIDMSKDESLKEKYLRNMSDRYDPLKRLVEEAKESAAKPSDVPDPYHEKRVQSGHNEADRHQIDMLKNKYVDFLKRHSHGQKEQEKLHEEVNMYLRARDALYRNPEMKKRLGVDDGSGMSDAQAHKILDDFKRRMRTPILDQAFKIMQEVKKIYGLQRLVDGGMLDQATADMLEKRNPDYAPQRTSRLDEEGIDRNSTRNMEAAAIKKALGRSTLSDNPVEFLFLQASDAAARTNENRTRQEMAKFVRMFPEVGKVRTVDKTSAYDLKTGKDAWIEDPHDVESENPLVVSFRENGKRMRIEFADTPRGRLLAESMRNEGVNRGPEAFDRMTRAWASTATQLSATFSGRNFQKDTVEVALNSAADTGFSGAGKFLKAQIAQMKPVVSTIREYLTKGTFGGPLGKEFKEFIDAGGSIGGMGREGYEDLKDTFSRKAKGLKMAFSGAHGAKEKVEAILGVTFGKIEDFNKTIEMMSRFNNYRSRRAKGESKKEAVIGSREDSTDFNMYGQQRWLNDVYMFSNSILGGTLRSTKQLATGKNGLKVATAVLAYGFVEAAADVLRNRGDDDEAEKSGLGGAKDLSERERSQTLYFRYGGKYIRIPVHGGPYSALKYTGGLLARAMLGKLSWSDAAKNAGKEWATIGTHFGGAGEIDLTNGPKGIVSSFTPSVARPVAELGMNQDFAGRHIYAPEGFDKTTPKSERGFKSTGDGYKWFARLMNKVGGGNESRSADWSWFDNPPEAYKHIVEAVGKNMVRDIMLGGETAGRAVESAANWENRFTRDDVPFLRDVTRNVPDNSRRYYAALDDYERDKAEYKKTTDLKRRAELGKEKPYLRPMVVDGKVSAKSAVDTMVDSVKELMHLERGEVKAKSGKWIVPKVERTEAQKEAYRKRRLALQARILKRLGR